MVYNIKEESNIFTNKTPFQVSSLIGIDYDWQDFLKTHRNAFCGYFVVNI